MGGVAGLSKLRNPPSIPLWGVISSHPDTVTFRTWTVQQVAKVVDGLKGDVEIREGATVSLHCQLHEDVARVAMSTPVGECRVSRSGRPAMVADVDNKLAGIEQHFGVNALGAHPRCSLHMDPARPRDLVCLSRVRADGT